MASIVTQLTRGLPAAVPFQWRGHAAELALYVGFYLLYLLLREAAFGGQSQALANAERIIVLESSLGLLHEPFLQEWFITNAQPLVVCLNWIYIVTYWPVILAIALALYLSRRAVYAKYRTLMAIHLLLALALFFVFPLVPPFKTGFMVDTIRLYGPAFYGSPTMAVFYNTNAAMPSLHFSWTCIFCWLFVRELRGWYRYLGVGYPLITLVAIVVTGNHYFLDAVVGVALIGVALVSLKVARRVGQGWSKSVQGGHIGPADAFDSANRPSA